MLRLNVQKSNEVYQIFSAGDTLTACKSDKLKSKSCTVTLNEHIHLYRLEAELWVLSHHNHVKSRTNPWFPFIYFQGSSHWVAVHHLQSQSGILDPDDKLNDVADDREQIIASFEDYPGPEPGIFQGAGDGASGSSVGTESPDIFTRVSILTTFGILRPLIDFISFSRTKQNIHPKTLTSKSHPVNRATHPGWGYKYDAAVNRR